MAENGGPSQWRPFGMAASRNGGPTPHPPAADDGVMMTMLCGL